MRFYFDNFECHIERLRMPIGIIPEVIVIKAYCFPFMPEQRNV